MTGGEKARALEAEGSFPMSSLQTPVVSVFQGHRNSIILFVCSLGFRVCGVKQMFSGLFVSFLK